MKTKMFFAAMLLIASTACNKEECYECHYDGPNGEEVELEGEYCGSAAEDLENQGYVVNDTTMLCSSLWRALRDSSFRIKKRPFRGAFFIYGIAGGNRFIKDNDLISRMIYLYY